MESSKGGSDGHPAVQEGRSASHSGNVPPAEWSMTQVMQDMGTMKRHLASEIPDEVQPHHQGMEPRASATLRDFRSLSPPEFRGGPDPLVAEAWLKQINKELDILEVEEDNLRITFATFQLVGEADHWWDSINREYDVPTMTWGTFEELFLGEYFSETMRDTLRNEFTYIEQREDEAVWEFVVRFDTLSRFGPELVATEADKCEKFGKSLKRSISSVVVPLLIKNFLRMRNTALIVEHKHEAFRRAQNAVSEEQSLYSKSESKGMKRVKESTVLASGQTPSSSTMKKVPPKILEEVCYNCMNPGHFRRDCPCRTQNAESQGQSLYSKSKSKGIKRVRETTVLASVQQSGQKPSNSKTKKVPPKILEEVCYNCMNPGHFRRDCPCRTQKAKSQGQSLHSKSESKGMKRVRKTSMLALVQHLGQTPSCPKTERDRPMNLEVCYNCMDPGHIQRNCLLGSAKCQEQSLYSKFESKGMKRFRNDSVLAQQSGQTPSSSKTKRDRPMNLEVCYNCMNLGHIRRDCPNRPRNLADKVCHTCGQSGHYRRKCPLRA